MTFEYVASDQLAKQICDVLELDVNQVMRMKIDMIAGEPAVVHVTMLLPDSLGGFVEELRSYRLVYDEP